MKDERRFDSHKLLWHMDRIIDYLDKEKKIVPLYLDMGLTTDCNLRRNKGGCIYCYGGFQGMTGEKIKEKALIDLFKNAYKIGIKGIGCIGDGEPTMNPALYTALTTGWINKLSLAISTNGLLLNTDSKLETILKTCEWMRFNLSASNKETYKQIHQVDGFVQLIKNVKRMIKLKKQKDYTCEIGFQSIFIPELMKESVIEEAQLAIDLGIDYFLIKQCSMPTNDPKIMYLFDLKQYDNQETINILKKAEAMSTKKTKIVPKWNTIERKGIKQYDRCLGPALLLQPSGSGEVYPCGHLFRKYDKKYLMGNLNKQSIEEIVNSRQYWDVINDLRYNFDVHTRCKGACRHDAINKFLWDYIHPPKNINFI